MSLRPRGPGRYDFGDADDAQHLISQSGYRQPDDYRDAIEVLRQEDVLEASLAERLKGWMAVSGGSWYTSRNVV